MRNASKSPPLFTGRGKIFHRLHSRGENMPHPFPLMEELSAGNRESGIRLYCHLQSVLYLITIYMIIVLMYLIRQDPTPLSLLVSPGTIQPNTWSHSSGSCILRYL